VEVNGSVDLSDTFVRCVEHTCVCLAIQRNLMNIYSQI
jgi:hypothetical protein